MPFSPARAAALDILLRVETTGAYASELLHSSSLAKLSPADHGLATEIVMGVLRWRSVLDQQIAAHLDKPLAKLDTEVLTALRIGAYQLLFLDRIPSHAAINDSVELVKTARKRSAAGLVNAVLRKISAPTPRAQSAQRDPSAALESHPKWLVARWERAYGAAAARSICSYDQQAPQTAIRADAPLVEELAAGNIRVEPGTLLKSAYTVVLGDITRTKAFHERRLIIQNEASQLVALLLGHGERILDCCAAPGGKTRILAEQNRGATVVAMELHPHRAALLKRLVPLSNVHVLAADARTMPFATKFDRILLDAPCTGTGTLARNPEIKWRLREEDVKRLQRYQVELLSAALGQVAPGGRVLYSTCSLEPEENEDVIANVLQSTRGFRPLDMRDRLFELRHAGTLVCDPEWLVKGPYLRTIPGIHPYDGFFSALLEREL